MKTGNLIGISELELMDVSFGIIGQNVYVLDVNNLEVLIFRMLDDNNIACVSVSDFIDIERCLEYHDMIIKEAVHKDDIYLLSNDKNNLVDSVEDINPGTMFKVTVLLNSIIGLSKNGGIFAFIPSDCSIIKISQVKEGIYYCSDKETLRAFNNDHEGNLKILKKRLTGE